MIRLIPVFIILGLYLISGMLVSLGYSWLNLESGLHPAIAFPVAIILAVWATYWSIILFNIYKHPRKYSQEELSRMQSNLERAERIKRSA